MGSGALPGPDLLAIPGASKVEADLEGGVSLISRAVLASTSVPAQRSNFPFRGAALPPASHFRQGCGLSGCASATMRYLALAWAAAHALQPTEPVEVAEERAALAPDAARRGQKRGRRGPDMKTVRKWCEHSPGGATW